MKEVNTHSQMRASIASAEPGVEHRQALTADARPNVSSRSERLFYERFSPHYALPAFSRRTVYFLSGKLIRDSGTVMFRNDLQGEEAVGRRNQPSSYEELSGI